MLLIYTFMSVIFKFVNELHPFLHLHTYLNRHYFFCFLKVTYAILLIILYIEIPTHNISPELKEKIIFKIMKYTRDFFNLLLQFLAFRVTPLF